MPKKDFGSVANAEGARAGNRKAPTPKMVAYAQTIARNKKAPLPEGYQQDLTHVDGFLMSMRNDRTGTEAGI